MKYEYYGMYADHTEVEIATWQAIRDMTVKNG